MTDRERMPSRPLYTRTTVRLLRRRSGPRDDLIVAPRRLASPRIVTRTYDALRTTPHRPEDFVRTFLCMLFRTGTSQGYVQLEELGVVICFRA